MRVRKTIDNSSLNNKVKTIMKKNNINNRFNTTKKSSEKKKTLAKNKHTIMSPFNKNDNRILQLKKLTSAKLSQNKFVIEDSNLTSKYYNDKSMTLRIKSSDNFIKYNNNTNCGLAGFHENELRNIDLNFIHVEREQKFAI